MKVGDLLKDLAAKYPRATKQIEAWGPEFQTRLGHAEGERLSEAYRVCMTGWTGMTFPKPGDIAAHLYELAGETHDATPRDRFMVACARHERDLINDLNDQFARGALANFPEYQLRTRQARDLAAARARDECGMAPGHHIAEWERWYAKPLTEREKAMCAEQARQGAKAFAPGFKTVGAPELKPNFIPMTHEQCEALVGRELPVDKPDGLKADDAPNPAPTADADDLDDDPFADIPPPNGPEDYGVAAR